MIQRKTFVWALLAGAVALPALGQDAAPAPAADDGGQRTGIEEITITARKVTENLQQTPLAVSAFDSSMLESLGISDTTDVSSLAPNLYLTQTPSSAANLALAIRGVGGAEPLLTREQGVAIYMDGAYIARVTGAVTELVDIERVEVLRGPQGTLYGRNATGGAVNFISRKPTEDFNVTASVGAGSFSRLNALVRVNTGELLPGLAATLSYLHNQVDGYVDNRLTDDNSDPGAKNTDAFRIAFGWDLTEELRLDYAYDHSNLVGATPVFQLLAVGPTIQGSLNIGCALVPVLTGGASTCTPPVSLQTSRKRLDKISSDSVGPSEHTIQGHNLSLEYDFGFATFKSITTYREWDNTEVGGDLDGNVLPSPLVLLDLQTFAPVVVSGADLFSADNERHQDQWTQELQLLGDVGDQFRYVAGFYYFTEDYSEENLQRLLFPIAGAPAGNVTAPFTYTGDARSWALFANGTYTLPFLEDRLSLTAGIRYSKDEKSFDRTSFPATSNEADWDNIDWEANLNYNITDNITTYFRAASAYKAGGFNLRSTTPPPLLPFDEEKLTSVELGVKSEWWDNRIRANLTGFWSLYKDLQTDVFAAGVTGATSITVNAGEAEIPGLEAEFLAVPFDGLTLNANVGWIKPKYNEYNLVNNAGTPNDPSDDFVENFADEAKFGYKPEVTATIGAEYATPPLGSLGWVITPRIDARYTASRIWSPLDDEAPFPVTTPFRDLLEDSGYWLLDVRLTVSEIAINDRAKLRMAVYGRNVTDESYMLSGIDFGQLDFAGGIYGEPSTWGIDFTIDY